MPLINMTVDMSDVLAYASSFEETTRRALGQAAASLTAATHAKMMELANQRLHSRRQPFADALSFKEVQKDVWLISLEKKAVWIDDGMKAHEMVNDMLKSRKAKTAKDGSRYLSVPLAQNKSGAGATKAQNDLSATVKSFLRNHNKNNPGDKIPYGSLEKNADGSVKTGLLHKFDIRSGPMKTHEGPGQGKGPVGSPRMGPTGIPFLDGIRIYQREVADKRAPGGKRFERNIMTFRTVSSKHQGTGRWTHPGLEAVHIMEDAFEWALNEWDTKIRPSILEQISR